MVRTDFVLPLVENYETARLEVIATLTGSSYSLAGLALIQKLGKNTWSLSLVTDSHPYKPELCSQVLAEVRELFKDFTNIKLDDPSVMYAQIPVSHASMWRYQIRMAVVAVTAEIPARDKIAEPGVRSLGYDGFPSVSRPPPPRTPSPDLALQEATVPSSQPKDPLDVVIDNYEDDPLFRSIDEEVMTYSEVPKIRGNLSPSEIYYNSERSTSPSNCSHVSGRSTNSERFTVENVLSFDKALMIQKYRKTNPKKLNVFFSLRRQALKQQKNTPQERLLRVIKKVLTRGLEFAVSGEVSPWKKKYSEIRSDTSIATSYVYSKMNERQKTELGVARSLAIIAQCKGINDKYNNYRRYLAQNYLLQKSINLHTDYGNASPSQLLTMIAQYNKMSARYYTSLKGYDHLIGFDRKKVEDVNPGLSHQFCQHTIN